MSSAHVADFAEVYALGALDERERAAIEAHAARCAQCARALASAERDVALIASMEATHDAPRELERRVEALLRADSPKSVAALRPRASWAPMAIAAALIVGLLPSAYFWSEGRAMRDAMLAQSAAMARLASAPHRAASFSSMAPGAAAAVMYATDGSWYVVVVRGASKPLDVAWMHDGTRTMLGNAVPHGNVGMLYLPRSHRMDRLALMDGDRVVAEAVLTWGTPASRRGASFDSAPSTRYARSGLRSG